MQVVLSIEEMQAVDEKAQSDVSLQTLIARAGAAAGAEAVRMLALRGGAYGAHVAVVAGKGNNGDDGRVAASLLGRRGARVMLVPPGVGELKDVDLVIDAAFGTGFHGSYSAPLTHAPVLAVDVPTGLDADLGLASEWAVRATRTITFGALKTGQLLNDGPECCGRIVVRDIGLPIGSAGSRVALVEDSDVVDGVRGRARDANKWSTAVMVVAGSPGMVGAAEFVASGALRAGAGMVRLGIPGAPLNSLPAGSWVGEALADEAWESSVLGAASRCRAVVVGPGLGLRSGNAESIRRLVATCPVPVVVDADGLTALAEGIGLIEARDSGVPVVLTPHDGEFARLAGFPPGPDRIGATRALAQRCGAVVLLKGATTVVADPSGRVLLVNSGTPALATAGSGDVLSGVIGGLLARGASGYEAAALGAHIHGLAARRGSAEGLVASDLPELVSRVLTDLLAPAEMCEPEARRG